MTKQDAGRDVASRATYNRSNGNKYILVAIVSSLATIGLVTCGFLLYQALTSRQAITPATNQIPGGNSAENPPTSQVPAASNSIQPGQFVQPAFGNKAQVELTAVRRIPGAPEEVSIEMKINRVSSDVQASEVIVVGSTTARNPITSETYQAVDSFKRSSGSASLYQMRQGEPVEAYVVIKVPQNVNAIDIYVNETQPFKNVPIADVNSAISGTNNSPANPASGTPLAANTVPAPSTTAAPTANTQIPSTAATVEAAPTNTQVPPVTSSASTTIQPGQFVQPAFGNKAQVELLSVKRIKDPEVGTRDVVNVQFRLRRIAAEINYSDYFSASETTARNPETSETYERVEFKRATTTTGLYNIRRGASVDGYVWLRIPEGVNTIDIYMQNTQAFKNIPIAS